MTQPELTMEEVEECCARMIAAGFDRLTTGTLCSMALAHLRSQPVEYVSVPREPDEEMWGGLARDIVMWRDMDQPTGEAMHRHFGRLGREIPDWLAALIPNTKAIPSKGNVAVAIYKAMIAVALSALPDAGKGSAT